MKFQMTILSLLFILILGGCSTAKVKNAWKETEYQQKTTSILVVAAAIKKGRRQAFEATLAKKLEAYAVKAIPSYTVFAKDEMQEQAVIDFISEKNIDSVIVVKVLNPKAIKQRVAPSDTANTSKNPFYRGFNGWYGDYSYWQNTMGTYDPNYEVSNLEASLYQRGNKKIVWSALVEIDGVDNEKSGIQDLANAIIKQMRKDGLI